MSLYAKIIIPARLIMAFEPYSEPSRGISSSNANDAAVLVPNEPISPSELPPVEELAKATSLSQEFDTLLGSVSCLETDVQCT